MRTWMKTVPGYGSMDVSDKEKEYTAWSCINLEIYCGRSGFLSSEMLDVCPNVWICVCVSSGVVGVINFPNSKNFV